jgi:hypothetical protein
MSNRLTVKSPIPKHLEDMGNLTMDTDAQFKQLSASSVTALCRLARRKSIDHGGRLV